MLDTPELPALSARARAERHAKSRYEKSGYHICVECHQHWPCDAAGLWVALRAAERRAAELQDEMVGYRGAAATDAQLNANLSDQLIESRRESATVRAERMAEVVKAARQWLAAGTPREYQLADGALMFALDELDEAAAIAPSAEAGGVSMAPHCEACRGPLGEEVTT